MKDRTRFFYFYGVKPQTKEARQGKARTSLNKHLPMLWPVFEESKEAKGKSGVDNQDRLALEPETSQAPPPANPHLFLYEPITTTTSVSIFFLAYFYQVGSC